MGLSIFQVPFSKKKNGKLKHGEKLVGQNLFDPSFFMGLSLKMLVKNTSESSVFLNMQMSMVFSTKGQDLVMRFSRSG